MPFLFIVFFITNATIKGLRLFYQPSIVAFF